MRGNCMNDLVLRNFEMTRSFFLRKLEGLTDETASTIPYGFNNNIHWNIGHVLTVTEQFMFGFPIKTTNLPPDYVELFGRGTRPSEWKENIPSVGELLVQLNEQVSRLKEIPVSNFEEALPKPFLGFETYGELANMALFHEAHHLGQIHVMRRLVEKN
jgi:hypothetical protein